jgi:hypothetical protein
MVDFTLPHKAQGMLRFSETQAMMTYSVLRLPDIIPLDFSVCSLMKDVPDSIKALQIWISAIEQVDEGLGKTGLLLGHMSC